MLSYNLLKSFIPSKQSPLAARFRFEKHIGRSVVKLDEQQQEPGEKRAVAIYRSTARAHRVVPVAARRSNSRRDNGPVIALEDTGIASRRGESDRLANLVVAEDRPFETTATSRDRCHVRSDAIRTYRERQDRRCHSATPVAVCVYQLRLRACVFSRSDELNFTEPN